MSDDRAVSIAIGKGLAWGLGTIFVSGVIGFCGALFVMYQDVQVLKTNNDKFKQQREMSIKQWNRMRQSETDLREDIKVLHKEVHNEVRELEKYIYTFHGRSILGVPHNHSE